MHPMLLLLEPKNPIVGNPDQELLKITMKSLSILFHFLSSLLSGLTVSKPHLTKCLSDKEIFGMLFLQI